MRNFRELDIWKDAIVLVQEVYVLIEVLPNIEKFGLQSQISRCVVSIPSNIAEGSAKSSQKDFVRFLEISLGSAFELETQLIICGNIGFIPEIKVSAMIGKLHILQKRINSLISYSKTKF